MPVKAGSIVCLGGSDYGFVLNGKRPLFLEGSFIEIRG